MRVPATDTAWRPLEFNEPELLSPPAQVRGSEPLRGVGRADPAEPSTVDGPGFAELLRAALERVNTVQQGADLAMERVATGDAEDLHEAIIAVEQADLALRLTAQVTQRAVEAYKEVSRMQV